MDFNDVCKLDFLIKPEEIDYFKSTKISGVYVLFIGKMPMYVGRSMNLRQRLYGHLNGKCLNTKNISNNIDEIGIHFFEDIYDLDFTYLEAAYIMEFNPPLNNRRNKWIISKGIEHKYSKRCKGPKRYAENERCNRVAHENGYCSLHGGNKITPKVLAENEVNKFVNENLQLKLII